MPASCAAARSCIPDAELSRVRRTSFSVRNQLAFRHSSRRRPWKLSTWAFCIGLPGWMWIRLILRSSAQPSMRRDVNSGPLSERRLSGWPLMFDQPIQCPCHSTAAQAGVSFQHQALAGKRIDHTEDADHAAICQSIHDEVHRPLLVRTDQTRLPSVGRGPAAYAGAGALPTPAQHTADKLASRSPPVRDVPAPHAAFDIRSVASVWPASPALPATPRSDPASARTDSWLDPRPAACRPCARSDEIWPRRTQCLLSDRQAPAVFSNHSFQRFLVQTQIGNQRLQSTILIFHLPKALRFAHIEAAVLRLPVVERRVTDPMLAAKIRRLHSSLMLRIAMICSSVYRLFFIPVLPLRLRENSSFPWLSFSGAGQRHSSQQRSLAPLLYLRVRYHSCHSPGLARFLTASTSRRAYLCPSAARWQFASLCRCSLLPATTGLSVPEPVWDTA